MLIVFDNISKNYVFISVNTNYLYNLDIREWHVWKYSSDVNICSYTVIFKARKWLDKSIYVHSSNYDILSLPGRFRWKYNDIGIGLWESEERVVK